MLSVQVPRITKNRQRDGTEEARGGGGGRADEQVHQPPVVLDKARFPACHLLHQLLSEGIGAGSIERTEELAGFFV